MLSCEYSDGYQYPLPYRIYNRLVLIFLSSIQPQFLYTLLNVMFSLLPLNL